MRVDIPEPKRCCFCLPLRRGLMLWAYLKLAFALFITSVVVKHLLNSDKEHTLSSYIIAATLLTVALLEIAFNILFLVRIHHKNYNHLWIYYRYAVSFLTVEVVALLGFLIFDIYVSVESESYLVFSFQYMAHSCFFVGQILLQAYFILLVRSEIRKLEGGAKIEFVNHGNQSACTAEIAA